MQYLLQNKPKKKMRDIIASDPQADILESVAALKLALCGIGFGKTWLIGTEAGDITINHPTVIIGIGANTYEQLNKSTLKGVFKAWKDEYGWTQYNAENTSGEYVVDRIPPPHFTRHGEALKSYKNTISFENGSLYFLFSLDNYKAIDGIELGACFLDETKDTKEEAVKEVILARLRQPGMWLDDENTLYGIDEYTAFMKSGRWQYGVLDGERVLWDLQTEQEIRSYNPLSISTSPAKVDWINKWFELTDHYEEIHKAIHTPGGYYKRENKHMCVVIAPTFHNEHNLPVSFIKDKLRQYRNSPNNIEMLLYGSPIAKSGGEFVKKFQRLVHVPKGGVKYIPNFPVHFTFDFNTAPYMTGLACQYIPNDDREGGQLRIFKEYCLGGSDNKTEAVCSAFLKDYGKHIKHGGLFYYGDPSGRNSQTFSTEYTDNYDVIEKFWRRYINYYSDRVLSSHPGILQSRDFLNDLFAGEYGIEIVIDAECINFIADLEYAKEDENGKMLKQKVKNNDTKQTYEKYGHCLDAFRYLICSLLEKQYEDSKN